VSRGTSVNGRTDGGTDNPITRCPLPGTAGGSRHNSNACFYPSKFLLLKLGYFVEFNLIYENMTNNNKLENVL